MSRIQLVTGVFLVVFIIDVLLHLFQPLGENFYIIGDFVVLVLSLSAVVFGLYAYKSHRFSDLQGKTLFFLTAGIFFWFLGETTWAIYEVILGIAVPAASIADVFWMTGYPLFLIGLYYFSRLILWPIGKKRTIFLTSLLIVVSFFMLYLLIPTITDVGLTTGEKISTAGYVVGDMLLLDALIVTIAYLFRSKFLKPWGIILLATVMTTVADILYTNAFDSYTTGSLIDLFWDLSYIIFALGFFYYREKWKEILSKT